jgi:hypothetical protein
MAISAKVKITNSGNGGDDSSSYFRKMVDELKSLKDIFSKATKLESAGLGGGVGSALASLLKGQGGLFAGGVAGLGGLGYGVYQGSNAILNEAYQSELGSYTNVLSGEDKNPMIAKINEKTGQIEELLTVQEAQQRGIVDENGRVKSALQASSETWDELSKYFEKYKGDVVITNTYSAQISKVSGEQLEFLKTINLLLQQEADEIRKRLRNPSRTTLIDTGQGYNDIANQQSIGYDQASIINYGNGAFLSQQQISNNNQFSYLNSLGRSQGVSDSRLWVDLLGGLGR